MAFIAEGEHVEYIGSGEPDAPLVAGDHGVVIMAAGGNGSHVQWKTGECTDFIYLTSNARLQVIEATAPAEEGYTKSDPHVHVAVCPRCNGEGIVPEEE